MLAPVIPGMDGSIELPSLIAAGATSLALITTYCGSPLQREKFVMFVRFEDCSLGLSYMVSTLDALEHKVLSRVVYNKSLAGGSAACSIP